MWRVLKHNKAATVSAIVATDALKIGCCILMTPLTVDGPGSNCAARESVTVGDYATKLSAALLQHEQTVTFDCHLARGDAGAKDGVRQERGPPQANLGVGDIADIRPGNWSCGEVEKGSVHNGRSRRVPAAL